MIIFNTCKRLFINFTFVLIILIHESNVLQVLQPKIGKAIRGFVVVLSYDKRAIEPISAVEL